MTKKSKLLSYPNILPQEADAVAAMFRLYDAKSTGKIPNHLAKKLIKSLGFKNTHINFSKDMVTLNELLFFIDQFIPDSADHSNNSNNNSIPLQNSLSIFNGLVAEDNEIEASAGARYESVIKPQNLSLFMEGLGRPPGSISECTLLLNSMLDYDDCSEIPILKSDVFNKEIILFARKNNLLRDFK